MGANAATLARGAGLALATILMQTLVMSRAHVSCSAAPVISQGDLLFLHNNMLLVSFQPNRL
jgi:hypothetical protein